MSSHSTRVESLFRHVAGLIAVSTTLAGCGGSGGGEEAAATPTAAVAETKSALAVTPAQAAAPVSTAQAVASVMTGNGWVAATVGSAVSAKAAYAASVTGRAWYVDLASGSDGNPGTLQAPWRTLAPTASMKMAAGDALLLKCGDVWRSTLELTNANAPYGNVLIGGYGDCSGERRPIIRGSDWVSPAGWSKSGAAGQETYVKGYAQPVSRLFLASRPLPQARFPNFKRVGEEFAIATQSTTNTRTSFKVSAADLLTLANKDVVGATVYIKVTQWETRKAKVHAFDAASGLITMDTLMPFPIKTGSGYILEGKPWMLDSAGEWYYDSAAKQLHLWTPTGVSPAQLEGLEASWRPYGLIAKWIANLRVERIAVEQQDDDGFELTETPDALLTDVKAKHAQEIGISVLSSPRAVVQDSLVEGSGRSGITVRETDFAHVVRNRVYDNGGFGRAGGSDAAIAVFGQGALAENNVVERSASLGIRFANRAETLVRGNTVMSFCLRFTDCAGIYTYTGGALTAAHSAYVAGALVEGNIVIGGKSNLEGCGYSCSNMALGIYLDELSAGVTLRGNTVSDTEVGIGVLNGSFNRVVGNTVRGSVLTAFRGTKTRSEATLMRGNQVTGNSFYTHRALVMSSAGVPVEGEPTNAQYWFHASDPASLFAGTDPNVVAGNENVSVMHQGETLWSLATWSNKKVLKQAEWKAYAPTDRQVNGANFKRYVATTDASVIANGSFDSKQAGTWNAYLSPTGDGGSFGIDVYSACGKSCGKLVSGDINDYLVSKPFSINGTAGQNLYLLKYTTTGGAGGGVRKAYVRRAVSPWENFGLNLAALPLLPGQTIKDEVFFRASGSSDSAVLDLRGSEAGETFFSDVSLVRIRTLELLNMQRLMSHIVNPTSAPLNFPCTALGLTTCELVDHAGARLSFPLTIPARGSKLVFARDATWLQ